MTLHDWRMSKLRPAMPKLGIVVPNMGTKKRSAAKVEQPVTMADALFSSTQQRVLGLLFGQPSRSYYANELIALAGIGSGAVQGERAGMERGGMITVRAVGNQRNYQANESAPMFS